MIFHYPFHRQCENATNKTLSCFDEDAEDRIIYMWARNAPPLMLPDGVGMKIGKEAKHKNIVIQVHYSNLDRFKDGSTDSSGVVVHYTQKP